MNQSFQCYESQLYVLVHFISFTINHQPKLISSTIIYQLYINHQPELISSTIIYQLFINCLSRVFSVMNLNYMLLFTSFHVPGRISTSQSKLYGTKEGYMQGKRDGTPKWTIEPLLVKLCDVKNISNILFNLILKKLDLTWHVNIPSHCLPRFWIIKLFPDLWTPLLISNP